LKYSGLLLTFVEGLKNVLYIGPGTYLLLNHFRAVIYAYSYLAGMFVPGRPFQPFLMFVGKDRKACLKAYGYAGKACNG
jgi:hypothetical protein